MMVMHRARAVLRMAALLVRVAVGLMALLAVMLAALRAARMLIAGLAATILTLAAALLLGALLTALLLRALLTALLLGRHLAGAALLEGLRTRRAGRLVAHLRALGAARGLPGVAPVRTRRGLLALWRRCGLLTLARRRGLLTLGRRGRLLALGRGALHPAVRAVVGRLRGRPALALLGRGRAAALRPGAAAVAAAFAASALLRAFRNGSGVGGYLGGGNGGKIRCAGQDYRQRRCSEEFGNHRARPFCSGAGQCSG
ncbi:MAG: hypothetical protein JJU18_09565 [Oceanicaulis sp.]|nr:hypothetical protein [Oceanicaulis sp.]